MNPSGIHWVQYHLVSSLMTKMMGQSVLLEDVWVIQSWEEWLICQKVVVQFRQTSLGPWILLSLTKGNTGYWLWEELIPCTSICWWLIVWKANGKKRTKQVLVDMLNMTSMCLVAKVASRLLGCIRKSVVSRLGEMIPALYLTLVRPHLRYDSSSGLLSTTETWTYWHKSNIKPWSWLQDCRTCCLKKGWESWDSSA